MVFQVCQALGISTEWSNHSLYTPGKFLLPWLYIFKVNGMKVNKQKWAWVPGDLELLDGPEPEKILVGPRVGIQYALPDDVNAPWRFAIAGSPWISAPKKTLTFPSKSEST